MDGERVDAAGQFVRKNAVDHAMALDPGLPFERLRHDIDPEMSLPARPVPGMAFVLVRFVHHSRLCGAKASVNFFVIRSAVRMLPGLGTGSGRVNGSLGSLGCFAAEMRGPVKVKS